MAHKVETMAYAGQVPWHGLGKKVPADLTPRQMLKAAQLDWKVVKVPATISNPVTMQEEETGHAALVRSSDGKQLDVVTDAWNPVQNQEAFDFFHEFVMAGDMEMHTAGSLKGGQIVWCLAKVKETFELFRGDQVENYLLFTNPHRFGHALDVRMTPIRVVCWNTLTLSLSKHADKMITLNHRKKFDPEEAKKLLGIAHVKFADYREIAKFLGSKKYTQDTLVSYFNEVFPLTSNRGGKKEMSRHAQAAIETVEKQPGANFAKGSWWQAFNAVTYMADHELGQNDDSRLVSSWYGTNRGRKLEALTKAKEYADAS